MLVQGGSRLFGSDIAEVLTGLPPAGFEMGGGIGPAIVGTLIMVALAAAISVPLGILAAIYLAMLDPSSKTAGTARFLAKVLTGFPSILAGVFVYAVLVVSFGYSALAGGVALAVLMLPTVVLAAEEAIKQVPQRMKDAAFGMGCTRTQVIWKVVLPTGLPGILTGVMLAIAGAAGVNRWRITPPASPARPRASLPRWIARRGRGCRHGHPCPRSAGRNRGWRSARGSRG